jgi:putative DNA primase/helicase
VHIVNASWTRGFKIPRQEHHVTRWFDPFCPKVVSGVNTVLHKTTKTRCITIKLLPKLPSETVEDFDHDDDDTFVALRSKFTRFAIDHVVALKMARSDMTDFNNRAKMNWKLQMAIADLAGGDWPKQARAAAIKLTHERSEPSEGKRLLIAFRNMFAAHAQMLTNAQVRAILTADETSEWSNFRGRGPINSWQIANLLDPYEIHPQVIHPRSHKADRGYKAEWFAMAFKHYLGGSLSLSLPTVRPYARARR